MIATNQDTTAMNPTERDLDLLRVLTSCTRVLLVDHIAAVWWPRCQNANRAWHRLEALRRYGWLERHTVCVHPIIHAKKPLFAWMPGQDDPDADRITHQAQLRWNETACPTEVFVSSRKTSGLLGCHVYGLPPLERRDHELHVASVYVQYRMCHQAMADMWVAAFALPKTGYRESRPDAILRDHSGRLVRAIRACGRCRSPQLEGFHDYCVEQSLPYELW